jgi:hypothetical protein
MPAKIKIVVAGSIFTVAFLVRSLHAVDLAPEIYTEAHPFGGLTSYYDRRATSIRDGEGLLGPYELKPGETIWLSRAPGYPIFLSAVYAVVGRDFFRSQLVQNLFDSLSPVIIFFIVGVLLSWRIGVSAGLLAAISHHLGYLSNLLLADSLCALPVLISMLCVVAARRGPARRWPLLVAAGVMIGISSWLRPQSLALGLVLATFLLIFFVRSRPAAIAVAVMGIISLLVVVPITLRNYFVYGAFIPISIGVGLNLWEGIADASGDRFGAVATDREVAIQEAEIYGKPEYAESQYSPDGIARDRERTRKSVAIIRAHPVWYAGVMLERMGEMLKYSAHAPLVQRSGEPRSTEKARPIRREWRGLASEASASPPITPPGWSRLLIRPAQRLAKEAMQPAIAIGFLGLLLLAPRRVLMLAMVPAYYLLFQSMMHTEFRYTLPMQYFVFVFAATTWVLLCTLCVHGIRRLITRLRTSASSAVSF